MRWVIGTKPVQVQGEPIETRVRAVMIVVVEYSRAFSAPSKLDIHVSFCDEVC